MAWTCPHSHTAWTRLHLYLSLKSMGVFKMTDDGTILTMSSSTDPQAAATVLFEMSNRVDCANVHIIVIMNS